MDSKELKDAMNTAVLRFLEMNDDDQVAEIARAQEAVAALPATTRPAVREYYEATVAMMRSIHDLRPPIREVIARSLGDDLRDQLTRPDRRR